MMNKYVIGIDGGTQSSKVSVFDLQGQLICSGVQPLKPVELSDSGHWVHPEDDVWESIAAACRKAMKSFPYDSDDIIGVGLCTIRCCRVLLNQHGQLTMPVISWVDPSLGEPYVHQNQRVAYVTTTSGYIGHRLCGEFKDTSANYEGVWPIDKQTWQWSDNEEFVTRCQVPREMLFELVNPGEKLGSINSDASISTGLPEGLPIFATANDKAVEALGAGLNESPTVLISLGTYIGGMAYGSLNNAEVSGYFHNMSCIPQRFLHESGGVRYGMGTVSWFRELLGNSVLGDPKSDLVSAEERLNQEASQIAIGSDGLVTLPDWLAPNEQSYKRGAMIGFNSSHTRGHIYRSILESIALTMKSNVTSMCSESGLVAEKLIISGGGANSGVFMQIFADVFALPIYTNRISGAAGLGAAICASVGSEAYSCFDEAMQNMVNFRQPFLPDDRGILRYAELNSVFKQISKQTDVINRGLYDLGFQS
jgi:sugar (pentulose or hexulose) kinase